jgi:hypothetical protein
VRSARVWQPRCQVLLAACCLYDPALIGATALPYAITAAGAAFTLFTRLARPRPGTATHATRDSDLGSGNYDMPVPICTCIPGRSAHPRPFRYPIYAQHEQRLSSSPYWRAQSRREIAQGARWAGLTAPECALCGQKSPPRRTLGWHRRAPKTRLELRWVRPGILQAHPENYKGAPWLGRGPHPHQGKGAPPRRTWSSAGCGQPWDGASGRRRTRTKGLARRSTLAGPGPTLPAHASYRGCTAAPSRRAPRSQLYSLAAQLSSQVRLQGSGYLHFC